MKRIQVRYETPTCTLISGPGSRDLVMKVTKRSPVWATISRGWVVQPKTAADVIAVAESRGYDVTIVQKDDDPGRGRW